MVTVELEFLHIILISLFFLLLVNLYFEFCAKGRRRSWIFRLFSPFGEKKTIQNILILYNAEQDVLEDYAHALFNHLTNKCDKGKFKIKKVDLDVIDHRKIFARNNISLFLFVTSEVGSSEADLVEHVKNNIRGNLPESFKYSIYSHGRKPINVRNHRIEEMDQILKNKCTSEKSCLSDTMFADVEEKRMFRAWKGSVVRNIIGFGPKNQEPKSTKNKKNGMKKKKKKKTGRKFSKKELEEIEELADRNVMVKGTVRMNLIQQKYSLVGSHSAVKLCRWVKNMLQGKGCCYKHASYGLTSYSCLQCSTAIACANKCVFCWRHNSNPVTRDWYWEHDEPLQLVEDFIQTQRKLIKVLRGLPNMPRAWHDEAMAGPKHCALSLIGEPLLYPDVNRFIREIHRKGISTFLVTNGQFPDRLERLTEVTQLYLSINAPNKEKLREISRPIFVNEDDDGGDFWARFLLSIDILRKKRERTVFRFTLIKGKNMCDLEDYVELIERGQPSFVEMKGVTFCNTEEVQMKDVPFHSDVRDFSLRLFEGGLRELGYGIAVEHQRTCMMLFAKRDRFLDGETGKWHTWIDFEKFTEIATDGEKRKSMRDTDYTRETPEWAVYGAKEVGEDPYYFKEKESR